MLGACAGGWTGSKEEKLAYFDDLEKETLARLVRGNPKIEQELAQSVGYAVLERKVVKVPLIGAGGGAGVVVEKAVNQRVYLRVPEVQVGAGWGARAERIVVIFQDITQLRQLANGKWDGASVTEMTDVTGDVGATGGASDSRKRGFSTYVLSEAGLSATATIGVLRVQPYSLD